MENSASGGQKRFYPAMMRALDTKEMVKEIFGELWILLSMTHLRKIDNFLETFLYLKKNAQSARAGF